MFSVLRNNNAFTMTELMVAILIAGIITAVASAYFAAHIKSYKTAENIVDIQYEGQMLINHISRVALESSGLYRVGKTDAVGVISDEMNSSTKIDINEKNDFFAFIEKLSDGSIVYNIYTVGDDNTILFSKSSEEDLSNQTEVSILAKYVESIEIAPQKTTVNAYLTYEQSDGIGVNISLLKDKSELDFGTEVTFRNK